MVLSKFKFELSNCFDKFLNSTPIPNNGFFETIDNAPKVSAYLCAADPASSP